jgi:hypothetical protein
MHRRAFVTGLGAVLAAPRATEGQQAGKMYRVGFVSPGVGALNAPLLAFNRALRDNGLVEGENTKALGLTIPPPLLVRADQIIE